MESLIKRFSLPLEEADELYASSAVEWLKDNTILEVDELEELPANVSLFIVKYVELMRSNGNIASESMAGMSQSFVTNKDSIASLWGYANALLRKYLKSQARFVPATRKWDSWE